MGPCGGVPARRTASLAAFLRRSQGARGPAGTRRLIQAPRAGLAAWPPRGLRHDRRFGTRLTSVRQRALSGRPGFGMERCRVWGLPPCVPRTLPRSWYLPRLKVACHWIAAAGASVFLHLGRKKTSPRRHRWPIPRATGRRRGASRRRSHAGSGCLVSERAVRQHRAREPHWRESPLTRQPGA